MKSLEIPHTGKKFPGFEPDGLKGDYPSATFELSETPWKEYQYRPEVRGEIATFLDGIFLSYSVRERFTRAKYIEDNFPVYEDSCVEFFISPDGKNYFNFEFNCIGTLLLQYGESRENRAFVNMKALKKIERYSTLGKNQFEEREGDNSWRLSVFIPFALMEEVSGIKRFWVEAELGGNFYKCGDSLSLPHYVVWNRIETEKPDYHRPEFFGRLIFQYGSV